MATAFFRIAYEFLSGHSLLARALLLAALTLTLKVPLTLMGSIVTDRQIYEEEAVKSIMRSWAKSQTFTGPRILVPSKDQNSLRKLVLLPRKLSISGDVAPEQRRRGLFSVTVYRANLNVVAEFDARALRGASAEGEELDWRGARLLAGVSEERSLSLETVDIDGQPIEWIPDGVHTLASLQASLASIDPAGRDTLTVRFRIAFAGSDSLSIVPIGQRTDVTLVSSWRSPSFIGPYLPESQTVTREGFQASWTTSSLGRGYGQVWGQTSGDKPEKVAVLRSAFGVALINPVDAYRETDRAIKYGVLFIGLTFAACLLFELATGTRPHALQYGLIGLSLCVFYLLLLSFAEQIGFGPAYLASAAAVAAQGAVYTGAVQRRVLPGLAFGALLGVLYASLYALLQLEDVALLSGSLLLFVLLSLAMWFTRNLHRTQPA
jgi:inner membrane protein